MDIFVQEAKGKLELVEKFVNRRGNKFVVCNEPTLADYYMFEVLDILLREEKTILDSYPKLKGIHNQMKNRSHIAAFLKSDRRFDKPVAVSDA
ncbi:Glutathione S-transferase P 1 [Galdieria sulphuraria]|nr:Glutathione S-transferase P 1 [Galdieria sulphuraria]